MRKSITLFAIFLLSACNNSSDNSTSAYSKSETELCIEKGIRYYQDIGSYPTLSNGQKAEEAAREKCSRTTGAF